MTDVPLLDRKLPDGAPAYFRSVAAYGKARGVTRQCAAKWNTRDGLIVFAECPVTGRQMVDALASDQLRAGEQNPLKGLADEGAVIDAGPVSSVAPEPVADGDPVGEDRDDSADDKAASVQDSVRQRAAQSKAIQEEIKAKSVRLDYEERIGRLIPLDLAMEQQRRLASRTVEAILRLPMEAAEEANPEDPAKARAAIQHHLTQILTELDADTRRTIEEARSQLTLEAEPAHA